MKSNEHNTEGGNFSLHDVTKMPEFYYRSDAPYSHVDPDLFFSLANHVFPSSRVIKDLIPGSPLITQIRERFGIAEENWFFSEHFVPAQDRYRYSHAMVMVRKNLMVDFFVDQMTPAASVLFSHETDNVLLEEVCEFLKQAIRKNTSSHIGLLTIDGPFGTQLTNINIEQPEISLETFYNDDLRPVHEVIVSKLNEPRGKGVVLLHGMPGTGKTTYLRHLASVLKKQLIFVPYEVAQKISSPDFLTFMLDHTDSVMILEDAENLLKTRDDGENLSVANLLNLSDGLLSDCLHMQLICTFNTDIARLDKALLRKGRIIARYEFKALSPEKSARLMQQNGRPAEINHPMTLAEIFHYQDEDYTYKKGKKIGF